MSKMYNFKDFNLLEWEENKGDLPRANWISYMDGLYKEIKKQIVPNIPNDFKIDYDRGKKITIHTDNKKDLTISIELYDDKIWYFVKPVKGIEFEFNFSFSNDTSTVIKTIQDEFNKDSNNGLSPKAEIKSINKENETDEDINEPILKKPTKKKKSIDINVIKDVLEDAYIVDDINLKNTSIQELIRRMLLESRKRDSI